LLAALGARHVASQPDEPPADDAPWPDADEAKGGRQPAERGTAYAEKGDVDLSVRGSGGETGEAV